MKLTFNFYFRLKVRVIENYSAYRYYVSDEVKQLSESPRSDYFVKYVDAFIINYAMPDFYFLCIEYFEVILI